MSDPIKTDTWIWGNEKILWGFSPDHGYTLKILEPKQGRAGCLSLQYHNKKSETWIALSGIAWALVVIDGTVCVRLMRKGDIQNLDKGVIHRLMAVTDDTKVLEPSTPDAHAADKSVGKDVVRLHCVMGRECEVPKDEHKKKLVDECIRVTEEAIQDIEAGRLPREYNLDRLQGHGFLHCDF